MYKPTIGIEVHAFLTSETKVFSNSKNEYSDTPNVFVNERDLGMPGVLPVLNEKVIDMALSAALALNCKINKEMHFDRKNYFYPDLPKGYQITQNKTPIGYDGFITINVNGTTKNIRIERIHIEEDTCKSIHKGDETLLNFNRAGSPLVEIVTKPDISNEEEAMLYVKELRDILLYLGISDVKMEEGSLRCDANISISKDESLGTKVEVKNIGSITNVKNAILYEIKRQQSVLESGGSIVEETRRYDDATKSTISMRVKETNNDYRYFPEPDIPKVVLSNEKIDDIKKGMPKLPSAIKKEFSDIGINDKTIEALILNKELTEVVLKLDKKLPLVKAANILTGEIQSYLNDNNLNLNETKFDLKRFEEVLGMLLASEISSKNIKEIIPLMLSTNDSIESMGIKQVSDEGALQESIDKVLNNNESAVLDFKSGNDKSFKFLMGQVMKETKGQANPSLASKLLMESLKNK